MSNYNINLDMQKQTKLKHRGKFLTSRRHTVVDEINKKSEKGLLSPGPAAYDNHKSKDYSEAKCKGNYLINEMRNTFIDNVSKWSKEETQSPDKYKSIDPVSIALCCV